ncbi:NAD-dependent epimerase/dehydratase family protein [Planctomicrobium sp. SH661]|uniref:NAD-dependent epimerase/dehydratase family protein n=1 Tax=Planctomicrobium sp. SH661 TaxID=3448124 RepID=UPI003F5B4E4D
MLALVTGGGGFLGRYIVEQLQARGDVVRVYSRGAYPEFVNAGVDVHQGDLRDSSRLAQAMQGVEAVFHVAAIPGIWGKWQTYYETNTLGTLNLIQAARSNKVQRLIYTSSPSVVYDGQPHLNADESLPYPDKYLCHYPRSKALAEQAVLEANGKGGLKTVALRPHLIWGPRDNHLIPRLIQRAQAGRLIRVGKGDNLVSMSYVENAAAAHLQAHDALQAGDRCAGKAYFINEPEPVSLWMWVNEILALAQLPPVRRYISPGLARLIGAGCEGIYTLLGRQTDPPMTRFLASQLSQSHTYSVQRARDDFNYDPKVSYLEGMRRIAPEVQALARGKLN